MNNLFKIHTCTIQVRATQTIYIFVHFRVLIDSRCHIITTFVDILHTDNIGQHLLAILTHYASCCNLDMVLDFSQSGWCVMSFFECLRP